MRLLTFVMFLTLAFIPDRASASSKVCGAPVFEIDAQGKVVRGSKTALRDAALRGDSLRVGWRVTWGQGPSEFVQHWAEAAFVTVFEDDVFTQIQMIHKQAPRQGKSHVVLPAPTDHWNASLGSNGLLVGKFTKENTARELRVAQIWCLSGAAAVRCQSPAWRLVYRHDRDGKPLAGNKQALFEAIRRGDPVRIAWGAAFKGASGAVASVEHSADPVFVTIASNKEIYAQLAEHIEQRAYAEPGKADFANPSVMWRGVFGTDGSFDAATVDRATGKTRRLPQRAALAWFAHAPEPACDARPPLELAVEHGVVAR
jgi:hypothetical protein